MIQVPHIFFALLGMQMIVIVIIIAMLAFHVGRYWGKKYDDPTAAEDVLRNSGNDH